MKTTKLKALVIQLTLCFAAALIGALLRPVRWVYLAIKWLVLPVFSAGTAVYNVRRGLNPYVSWILPPLAATAAGFLVSMGYSPDAGGIFFCALAALVGAAAGDVMNRETSRARRKSKGR